MQMTIKEWRRAKGISQEEMADTCGVHVNTYRAWEENPEAIKITNATKISERLGVSMSDIDFLLSDTTRGYN